MTQTDIYVCLCACVYLALNNLQWLIYYKTKPNQSKNPADMQSVYSTAPANWAH